MPIVKAICTNCGANLEVDNAKDAAICPMCNTPYIVERAIHNYFISTENNVHDSLLEAGEKFLKEGLWDEAANYYRKAEEKNPSDYRAFWGQFCALSKNMTWLGDGIADETNQDKIKILYSTLEKAMVFVCSLYHSKLST